MFLFVSVHQMDFLQYNIMAVADCRAVKEKKWNIKYKVGNAGDIPACKNLNCLLHCIAVLAKYLLSTATQ